MSSQVLARKYRPQHFEDVVGQEVAVQILKNTLVQKRLHHGYLWTGPRGVGKTTLARIFAKALNCETGPTATPCLTCVACKDITEGRSLCVSEIDGASNTSVEDVRDLRDKVRYLPAGGRYKIYIIDEVHMLSTAAFNALLKTLEEPPPHAIFLFATTDPQKVPITVLSRIIRIDLRAIGRQTIANQLKKICETENIQIEDDALLQIAREGQGSLRDALSLLDQIISFSGSPISLTSVEQVVGVSSRHFILRIIDAILDKNGQASLAAAEEAFQAGIDLKRLALDLLESFRHLLVAQVSQDAVLFDLSAEEIAEFHEKSKKASSADLDALFRILQKGISDLLRAATPKILLDVLLLRLATFEGLQSVQELISSLPASSASAPTATFSRPVVAERPVANPTPAPVRQTPPPPPLPIATASTSQKSWGDFTAFLKTQKPQLSSIIEQGSLKVLGETEILFQFPPRSMHASLLKDADRMASLKTALTDFFGKPMVFRLTELAPAAAVQTVSAATATAPASENASNLLEDAISIFQPAKVTNPTVKGSA